MESVATVVPQQTPCEILLLYWIIVHNLRRFLLHFCLSKYQAIIARRSLDPADVAQRPSTNYLVFHLADPRFSFRRAYRGLVPNVVSGWKDILVLGEAEADGILRGRTSSSHVS